MTFVENCTENRVSNKALKQLSGFSILFAVSDPMSRIKTRVLVPPSQSSPFNTLIDSIRMSRIKARVLGPPPLSILLSSRLT